MTTENTELRMPEKRERSTISFPYGDLDSAVKVAQTIYEQAGDQCQLDQLAAWMSYSAVDNGAFRQQTNAARIFGITASSRNSIQLTELGQRVVDPQREAQARVDAFLSVPLYRSVYDKYRGHPLPPGAGLENVFAELGVARKQTDKARQVFQRSAQQAGFFNGGTDRLVSPNLSSHPQTGVGSSEANGNASTAAEPTHNEDLGGGKLHPLIQGLVATLPEPGSEWDEDDRNAWLTAAKSNFALIYERKPRQLPPGKPESVGQESDRG